MFDEIQDFLLNKKPKYCPLKDTTCGADVKVADNILQAWYGVDFLQVEQLETGEYIAIVKQKRYDNFRQCERIRETRKMAGTQAEVIKFIRNRLSGGEKEAA
ncbi:MAG: hypothetical protein LUE14_07750 [Clostridiales bacterium]|nr:hypothetical protein [Clostridiales bacterium]